MTFAQPILEELKEKSLQGKAEILAESIQHHVTPVLRGIFDKLAGEHEKKPFWQNENASNKYWAV